MRPTCHTHDSYRSLKSHKTQISYVPDIPHRLCILRRTPHLSQSHTSYKSLIHLISYLPHIPHEPTRTLHITHTTETKWIKHLTHITHTIHIPLHSVHSDTPQMSHFQEHIYHTYTHCAHNTCIIHTAHLALISCHLITNTTHITQMTCKIRPQCHWSIVKQRDKQSQKRGSRAN